MSGFGQKRTRGRDAISGCHRNEKGQRIKAGPVLLAGRRYGQSMQKAVTTPVATAATAMPVRLKSAAPTATAIFFALLMKHLRGCYFDNPSATTASLLRFLGVVRDLQHRPRFDVRYGSRADISLGPVSAKSGHWETLR